MARVLIVDDELSTLQLLSQLLGDLGHEVRAVSTGEKAIDELAVFEPHLVLTDLRMKGASGLDVLKAARARPGNVPVIILTAYAEIDTAVEAIREGASDYLPKPFHLEDLRLKVELAMTAPRGVAPESRGPVERRKFPEMIGQSPVIQELFKTLEKIADTDSTVLIAGESGTGKELIARAIHRQGPRRDRPFVAVNPAAVAETLVESELFGHKKGAFTGAYQKKLGKLEMAQGGSLFLDEIASLKPEVQAKLLRVLQEREIERVGGTQSIKIDVRVIAATNVDLKQAVAQQRFREDLYYRLNVVPITVPPLRARREDIPLLVDHFVRRYSHEFAKPIQGLSPEALVALREYPWPGNVRELQNVIERSVVLVDAAVIGLNDLPLDVLLPDHRDKVREAETLPLHEASDQFERQIVMRVLERVGWNQSEAARLLGVHRNSLKLKLARWKVRLPGRPE